MTDRQRVIDSVLARAAMSGRKVYGFQSGVPGCDRMVNQVRKIWDWITVEGDKQWTRLPQEERVGHVDPSVTSEATACQEESADT